jgi:hypothetical protein
MFSYSLLCFPVLGALSMLHGFDRTPGLLAILYIVSGAWLLMLNFFEVDEERVGPVIMLGLTLAALIGSGFWIAEQWGGRQWLLAWGLSVFWVFAVIGYLLTLISHLKSRLS